MFLWIDVLRFEWCAPARFSMYQMWKSLGCDMGSLAVWLVLAAAIIGLILTPILWKKAIGRF